jgi:hypothetical protein
MWTKTSELMPPKYQSVLVSDGTRVGIGEWYGIARPAEVPYWKCDTCEIEEVKYWQPLPLPPRAELS